MVSHTLLATIDMSAALGRAGASLSDLAYVHFQLDYTYLADDSPVNGLRAHFEMIDASGNTLRSLDVGGGPIAIFQGEDFTRPSVGAVWQLTPVPEPATWALMLGGLVGVGALARRRGAQPKA